MTMEKEIYQQPTAEIIYIDQPLTLLVDFSADGKLDDWEDGGDL